MTNGPPYVILIEQAPDIEDLRDWAYAAANRGNYWTTEHWDDPVPGGAAFHFMVFEAAFSFMAHCARSGIAFKGGCPSYPA